MSYVKLKATDGTEFEFDDGEMAGSGGMKDVYFSRDKKTVVVQPKDAYGELNPELRLKLKREMFPKDFPIFGTESGRE